jgi:hypothetical protein
MKTLERAYTDLHEGQAPDRMLSETVPARPSRLWTIGRITAIQYRKIVPGEEPSYKHDFAPHAQPLLARDERGKLWIFRGKYVVSDEDKLGITDLPRAKQSPESLPHSAKNFVDLGKLEWIRYRRDYAGRRETGTLDFDGATAPVLAHHAGDLWLLRGNYKNLEGTETNMAKVARANPAQATMSEKSKAVIYSAAGVGGVGLVTVLGMNMLLPKVIKDPAVTAPATGVTLAQRAKTEYKRAAAEIGVGLLAAVGVFLGVKAEGTAGHVAATVSGGIGAGAVIGGGMRLVGAYKLSKLPNAETAYVPPGSAVLPPGYVSLGSKGYQAVPMYAMQ